MCKYGGLWHTAVVFKPSPIHRDPDWHSVSVHQPPGLTPEERRSLLDEESLTERLNRASEGNFRVQRLAQR